MIKAGDKVILDGVEYVIKEIKGNDVLLVKRDDALNIMFMNEKTLYAKLYEQQKQRADELEKRWSELVDVLNKKYEYYKVRADDEIIGPIERDKWKIAKLELMMVLMTMAELQEDDND